MSLAINTVDVLYAPAAFLKAWNIECQHTGFVAIDRGHLEKLSTEKVEHYKERMTLIIVKGSRRITFQYENVPKWKTMASEDRSVGATNLRPDATDLWISLDGIVQLYTDVLSERPIYLSPHV